MAAGRLALLVGLTICQIVLQVRINTWSANLFDALEDHDTKAFLVQIGVLAAILVAGMAITGSHLTVKRKIQLDWRRRLTRRMLGDWMEGGHQFLVTHMPGEHDNPDGRI
ncbi:MAG TPA: ABC transporter ATP-binding protein/permease, partial [Rhodospirillaceae bacterium]|nr:ABC transporter ATP-binding protein/permease [Rhodospirillaceae bacterium]